MPRRFGDAARRAAVLAELDASGADLLILLGDEPVKHFLGRYDRRWARLSDFGKTEEAYGRLHDVGLAGRRLQVLPLVHVRQAARLGAHDPAWSALHARWVDHVAPSLVAPAPPPT